MSIPTVQLFISTRNRLETLKRTIDSALNQSRSDFQIIISDNSTNDETMNAIRTMNNSRLGYIKRSNLGNIEHLNAIINDVSADCFMVFHDDDLMHEDMIDILYKTLWSAEKIIAVGSNALLNINGRITGKLFSASVHKNVVLHNAGEVAFQYLTGAATPFPSYLYKKVIADKLRLDMSKGDLSCDMAFIMDLTAFGYIELLCAPYMDYTIHRGQMSAANLFRGQMKLVNYIGKQTNFKRTHPLVKLFRIRSLYGALRDRMIAGEGRIFSSRYRKIVKLIFRYSPFGYFPKIIIVTVLIRFRIFGY